MKRIYFIDWLRILAILIVFVFHNSRFFDTLYWHVKNPQQNQQVLIFVSFVFAWIMPLFFVLAGGATIFSMKKKFGAYTLGRTLRLLVPYIMGVILIVPPQKYLEAISHYGYQGSFFHFIPDYAMNMMFNQKIGFNPLWIGSLSYHLWFLGHLFLISVIAYPFFRYINSHETSFIGFLEKFINKTGIIFLFFLPLALVSIALKKHFPDYTGWTDFTKFLLFFIYGFIIMKSEKFREGISKNIIPAAITGTIIFVISIVAYKGGTILNQLIYDNSKSINFILQECVFALNTWAWLIVFLGLGMRFLNKESKWRSQLNEAVLPFYILHQTVILIIGFFVVQWDWNNWGKFGLILTSSFLIIMTLYVLVIKPFNPVRFLFGMQSRK